MKTNFKKTLAVFLAVLMLASVFSVTAFAATYTITYMPGEGVEGEVYVDEFTSSIKIRKATYTREGFTQTGWTQADGGSVVAFNSTWRKRQNVVLYPVWKGDTYELTYDPGAYGTGEITKVSVEYGIPQGLLGAIFTRDQYVQTGWSLTDGGEKVYELNGMSAPITGNTTLYPYWAQMCNIVYTPGEFGVGQEVVESVQKGETFNAKDAIFTRDGYTQAGWSFTDGGYKIYSLLQNFIPAEGDLVLYPYWIKNEYKVDINTNEVYFGDFCENYVTPEGKTFVITNSSNVNVTVNSTAVNNYSVSFEGSVTLAAGESLSVLVQPKDGLTSGDYSEAIVITADEIPGFVEEVKLTFSVSDHVFGEYKSDNNATYSADGTKTAECVKNCGAKHTIADPGTMKVYSADNNDAVGLVKSYVHHRTVRFTAYGSGMDDAEGVVGKRFVPVTWYVNEEFNGEFEDGYDVVFTHTIFGSYTLTINYVEEEYNAETGEWVATGVTDEKTFDYTVGTTEREEQEIVRPNTILNIIFGLFQQLLALLGLGG